MEVQETPSQEQDGLAGEVMDSVGMSEQPAEAEAMTESEGSQPPNESLAVQKRLKSQKRAHEREVRELHARISDMESRMIQPNTSQHQDMNNAQQPSGIDEQIHKAVSYALQHKEMEERKAHEARQHQHVQRQYQDFEKHLDKMGDKYDDAHEVIYGDDTPFTPAMRDYALTLPTSGAGSAGEVLYKLGKAENREELHRISKLHPLDQAREMAKLSHALNSGGESKNAVSKPPMGNIKNNPVVNTHAITDKTSIGDLRKRM
jgi:hypothetical protein